MNCESESDYWRAIKGGRFAQARDKVAAGATLWLQGACDLLLWSTAGVLAYWLRTDTFGVFDPRILEYTGISVAIRLLLILIFGLHRQTWHKISVRDLRELMRAVGIATLALYALGFLFPDHFSPTRSVPLIDGALAVLLMGGVRLTARMRYEHVKRISARREGKRVLVIGAGECGTMITRELLRHPETGLVPVGFLDDNPSKLNRRIQGLRVWGRLDELADVARARKCTDILIAMPSAPGNVVRMVVEAAEEAGLHSRTVPALADLISGKVGVSQIREVAVEDLLRREPVRLQTEKVSGYLQDRVVLVTGAGGSIGSEIVRQVAAFKPRVLLLLGRGENSLFQVEREIDRDFPNIVYNTIVADVRHQVRIQSIFQRWKPDVVFHAAAHKHVPLMEANPEEAILNNVGGTRNLVDAALAIGTQTFVNISTDKAVNPTSVMGASKRVAELVVLDASLKCSAHQTFCSVRFGNVLGSRGSVVPLFREQIQRGGPITVTHPEMRRYFMTIPEAARLVLQAGGLQDNGRVYVLNMGQPVRIVDLARDMIHFSGLEPETDIEIKFTGVRPGEKLYEELLTAEEGTKATCVESIYTARAMAPADSFTYLLNRLIRAAEEQQQEAVRARLGEIVESFRPPTKLEAATSTAERMFV